MSEVREPVVANAPQNDPGSGRKKSSHYAGRFRQVGVYLGKFFRIFIYEMDWKVLPMAALIAWIVSYVVGANCFRNQEGTTIGALAIGCICIWNGFFNSIQVVCRERPIIKREHRSGMHITSYIGAQMIYQAFLCICQVIISMVVFHLTNIRYPQEGIIFGHFVIDFAVTLFLITYAADMLALMVSCIVKDTTSAMTVMPMLLIIELVFSGVAFPLYGTPAKIANATVSQWGIYAIMTDSNYNAQPSRAIWTALYKFRNYQDGDFKPVGELMDLLTETGKKDDLQLWTGQNLQNANYNFTKENILKDWGILIAFAAVYAGIGIISLEFIDRDKR